MLETLSSLFNSEDFMPHGHCFMWLPQMLWLHIVSDAVIALSYFSIPVAVTVFAYKRRDLPFRYIFALFGAFIVLCGSTHILSIWVLWNPDYGFEGLVKALTALISAATAGLVWRILPKALLLPSPSDLQVINANLQQNNARIEREVQKRTLELQAANHQLVENEKALQLALQQAETASRAKTEFLANMSHEIRTPMNALVGLTQVLAADQNLTPRQRECIRTMDVSASALMDLLNDLLDIAKIETGHIELYDKPFNLRGVLNDAMTIMMVRAKEKGLALALTVADILPGAHDGDDLIGDPARLRQILTNLLGNAIKFTAKGGVTLHAAVQPMPQGLAHVTLEITDTGIGIKPEHLPHIFEKFNQADTSISRRYGGSGLGLAITHGIVDQMKGQITVKSAPGAGSSFVITLDLPMTADSRLLRGDLVSASPKASATAPATPTEQKAHGLILLVEDWQPNILVAGLMLEMLGYKYETAQTGEQAVEMAVASDYQAILMDIQLPGIDGFESARRIRAQEQLLRKNRTPIIAITAYAMKNDQEKCLAAGMDHYLSKPLDYPLLAQILKTAIKPE